MIWLNLIQLPRNRNFIFSIASTNNVTRDIVKYHTEKFLMVKEYLINFWNFGKKMYQTFCKSLAIIVLIKLFTTILL